MLVSQKAQWALSTIIKDKPSSIRKLIAVDDDASYEERVRARDNYMKWYYGKERLQTRRPPAASKKTRTLPGTSFNGFRSPEEELKDGN